MANLIKRIQEATKIRRLAKRIAELELIFAEARDEGFESLQNCVGYVILHNKVQASVRRVAIEAFLAFPREDADISRLWAQTLGLYVGRLWREGHFSLVQECGKAIARESIKKPSGFDALETVALLFVTFARWNDDPRDFGLSRAHLKGKNWPTKLRLRHAMKHIRAAPFGSAEEFAHWKVQHQPK